jgi:hypothetical protein
MAGSVAAELGSTTAEGEEAFIGALFQNLGRMLSQFYFPEEAASIRTLVNDPRSPVHEDTASNRVLGMSFEALGLGAPQAYQLARHSFEASFISDARKAQFIDRLNTTFETFN